MKIGFDLMGGDVAPKNELEALKLLSQDGVGDILAVGRGEFEGEVRNLGFEFRMADEVVGMHEIPMVAVKQKRNSSLAILFSMLKRKEIDALVSAGNTGAIMGFSVFDLGIIEPISKPGLAITMPTQSGYMVMIDIGANIKPKPIDFVHYGIMGAIFSRITQGKENPKVGILNIGSEGGKGDEIRQKSYELLKESSVNFIGNLEGNDIMKGFADVVVSDGFTGNVVLKFTEGIVDVVWHMLRETVDGARRRKVGQFLVRPAIDGLKAKFSYEEYGGGILLGVEGVVIIGHGRSSPFALKNAIRLARSCVESNIIEEIKKEIKK